MARATKEERFEDVGLTDAVIHLAERSFLALPASTRRDLAEWLSAMIQPSGRELSATPIRRAIKDCTGHEVSADALAGGLLAVGVLPAARFPAIDTPRGRLPTVWLFHATFSRAYKIERQRQLERGLSL